MSGDIRRCQEVSPVYPLSSRQPESPHTISPNKRLHHHLKTGLMVENNRIMVVRIWVDFIYRAGHDGYEFEGGVCQDEDNDHGG